MSELVVKSMHEPQDFSLRVSNRPAGIRFHFDVPDKATRGLTISFHDARQLRDFLNKELDEQAPEPMGSRPWVYLERSSNEDDFWVQFPTEQRARDYAMKRICSKNTHQMLARCHQALVPETVTTTSYEWKDIV